MEKKISSLVQKTHELFKSDGLTLSTAESCTGGLIGGSVTSVSGSSILYEGGIIAYSNQVKRKFLNVSNDLLNESGAVSEPVAHEMAIGVKKRFQTDFSVSVTGIAGPSGGTSEKPVGLVYFGFGGNKEAKVTKKIFSGDREQIRTKTVRKALRNLNEFAENFNQ